MVISNQSIKSSRIGAIAAMLVVVAMCGFQADQEQPASQPSAPDGAAPVYVAMKTTKGVILLELDPEKAPISVGNFMSYVDDDFYDGTIFHRVIPGFMAQAGGFTADMQQKKTKDAIKNESGNGLSNVRGSIAMARTPALDSATSQFFINVVDNLRLDTMQYAVFGKVVDGMDIVDAIVSEPTGVKSGMADVPIETITIEEVHVVSADDVEKAMKGKGDTGKSESGKADE